MQEMVRPPCAPATFMFALPLLRSPRRSLLLSSTILLQHQKHTTAAKGARTVVRMAGNGGDEEKKVPQKNPSSNPKVAKFEELLSKDPLGGWDECWKGGYTPWDLGKPTPVVMHLLQTDALPKGRVLVPGCGTGHDVVAIAGPERYVVGLEISETAVGKSRELFSSLPNANYFTFLAEDFFSWRPNEMFDLVFDYTFFCAIDPCMRSAWAEKIQDVLKPDGELITLMFPIGDYDHGPPYALSLSNYENVLSPLGFKAISVVDNELAIGPRKGREKLGRWKRCSNLSLL